MTSDKFFQINQDRGFPKSDNPQVTWDGQLTKQQRQASLEIIDSISQNKDHLLWAVTGAGKTETLFPVIEAVIKAGKRIALAAPRIDVVLELSPRIKAAFAGIQVLTMYGGVEVEYFRAQITVMTTHQLMKFQDGFDLIIIDEVDSFPFVSSEQLEFAVQRALKLNGNLVYLSATPTEKLLKLYKAKKLNTSFLARRFHTRLLPQIKVAYQSDWQTQKDKKKLHGRLKREIEKLEKDHQRFLLFVPTVDMLEPLLKQIHSEFKMRGETVWSGDEKRKEKVILMREGKIDFLITTTILERGVTLPGIDVIIFGADHINFNKNALIQIAGRVGRSLDRPYGLVLAILEVKNRQVVQAIKQINFMNKKAKEMYE
ncbi:MAG: DEAD/DEAH box helicase family protein [Lactobacillaceae bacterium]|nr:DEAD/DEAH box helicase family protein [Lactobacillaceae bacterium]